MYPGTNADISGNAVPGWVTVTTPYTEAVVWADPGCNGCWNCQRRQLPRTRRHRHVTAGSGTMPVIINIPDPLSAEADSTVDTVSGQIDGWLNQGVQRQRVDWPWRLSGRLDRRQRLLHGHLRRHPARRSRVTSAIYTMIDYAEVNIRQRFRTRDLTLQVNYGHDWIEGEYEARPYALDHRHRQRRGRSRPRRR